METSSLTWAIAHDANVLQRVEAIVREHRWAGRENPTAPVPVDQLAWAVATNATIRDGVEGRLDDEAPSVSQACAGIPDTELTDAVLNVALPRLASQAAG